MIYSTTGGAGRVYWTQVYALGLGAGRDGACAWRSTTARSPTSRTGSTSAMLAAAGRRAVLRRGARRVARAGSTSAPSTCSRRSSPRPTLALMLAKMLGESRRAGARPTATCCIAGGAHRGAAPAHRAAARPGHRGHAAADPAGASPSSPACRCSYLGIAALVAVLAAPVAWTFALQDYQKERISTFLDPEQDPRGAGYQQIQARITVGSGGVSGKGFMEGTQGQLRFLPVAHNDFIFSVLAEEQGFVGVLVALGLVPVRDHARARGGPAGQGPPRRLSRAGRARRRSRSR